MDKSFHTFTYSLNHLHLICTTYIYLCISMHIPESCKRANAAISIALPLNTKSRKQPTKPCRNVAVQIAGGHAILLYAGPVPPTYICPSSSSMVPSPGVRNSFQTPSTLTFASRPLRRSIKSCQSPSSTRRREARTFAAPEPKSKCM